MASFLKAFKYVMENEGGYSDNPADRGGKTNYGITISTYSFFLNRRATDDDMKSITEKTAEDVYRKFFWVPLCLDMVVSDSVAIAMFDQAVNRGPGTVAREVQKLIGVPADGIIGRHTLDAINDYSSNLLVKDIADCAEANYKILVARDETQKVFLDGWMNRVERLRKLA